MRKKTRVAVLMGGKSPEHEVSLASGREVVRNLDRKKYVVKPIVISRDGVKWRRIPASKLLKPQDTFNFRGIRRNYLDDSYKEIKNLSELKRFANIVFVAMHGPFGEDGTIQGLLDYVGIKYTGSDVMTSSLCMDKDFTKKILSGMSGIFTPKGISVMKGESTKSVLKQLTASKLSYPLIIKPNSLGSSVGMSIAKNKNCLSKALEIAYSFDDIILIEEYISGIELTYAVLGNDKPVVLPLIEIIPENDFFDFHSKYLSGTTKEIIPARISKEFEMKVKSLASNIYEKLRCKGYARVDFILTKGGEVYLLEVNTLPGLTKGSLFPKTAKKAGHSMSSLLDIILSYA